MDTGQIIVEKLQSLWPKNKAKGLLAQSVFLQEISNGKFGADAEEKIVTGCWLLAPKRADFYKFRFCFFIHPTIVRIDNLTAKPKEILGKSYRPFHAIAEFMNNAGIGVIYVVPQTLTGRLMSEDIKGSFEEIQWTFFSFKDGNFVTRDPFKFFEKWDGDRGRPSRGGNWDISTKIRIGELSEKVLTALLLNELFYSGFVKGRLKKPINDPYDVDSFLISISQKHIFPMEIKEKFPGRNRNEKFFGIDAGRVMMLLRLCLPNDANAVYLIRELDEEGDFIGWRYITLSDIIMTSGWNLQAGGPGMGGQSTQTIRLPYHFFKNFDESQISEDNLRKIGSMPHEVKVVAKRFGEELASEFND